MSKSISVSNTEGRGVSVVRDQRENVLNDVVNEFIRCLVYFSGFFSSNHVKILTCYRFLRKGEK